MLEVSLLRLALLNVLAALTLGLALQPSSAAAEGRVDQPLTGTAVVLGTDGSGLKVRSGPGPTYDSLGVLPEGTRVQITNGPQSDGDQNWYQVRSTDGDGARLRGWVAASYLVDADDVVLKNDRVIGVRAFSAKVTSYASGNGIGRYTSTGTRVHWGTVAVDPSFIPLGSLMMIDGLDGVFTAEDTGPGVRGSLVDVWFPDLSAALRWGTQQRSVTIVREGY
jgi:3D (Asp-Asp-Asp) domain-containing protein